MSERDPRQDRYPEDDPYGRLNGRRDPFELDREEAELWSMRNDKQARHVPHKDLPAFFYRVKK